MDVESVGESTNGVNLPGYNQVCKVESRKET